MRIPLLLSSDALSEAQRWQLTSSLYDQVHSLIEGSAALFATLAVCASYTGWWGFWTLACITVLLTILRLSHWRRFLQSRSSGAPSARSPEAWARDYTILMCAMAALWAATLAAVTFLFHDMQLVMFVLLLQSGWLAAAGIRSAASPATIFGQALITVVPASICFYVGTNGVIRLLSPACFILMIVLLRVARLYGAQILSLMESEQELTTANAQLLTLSRTDGLTGLSNRRAFDERFAAAWAFAVREARDIAVALVDVDHFKRYNDHYGHLAGDDCLRAVAGHVAGAVLRASDVAARYGGEEFVLLLAGNSDHGASEIAHRLCHAVYDAAIPHAESALGRVTISVGVASLAPGLDDRPAMLLVRADQALYKAKQAGRNQVCVATPTQPVRGGTAVFSAQRGVTVKGI
jgi:diguanylate cyclase (GGDEF)-like protein